jgi:hypothetical protein
MPFGWDTVPCPWNSSLPTTNKFRVPIYARGSNRRTNKSEKSLEQSIADDLNVEISGPISNVFFKKYNNGHRRLLLKHLFGRSNNYLGSYGAKICCAKVVLQYFSPKENLHYNSCFTKF